MESVQATVRPEEDLRQRLAELHPDAYGWPSPSLCVDGFKGEPAAAQVDERDECLGGMEPELLSELIRLSSKGLRGTPGHCHRPV